MTAIIVEGLTKQFRVRNKAVGWKQSLWSLLSPDHRVVDAVRDVSFRIESGEIVAFLGPNGAGKTTTLKLLSGLIYPTSGKAEVLGYVPWHRKMGYRLRFALVMGQKNQLWWDLPATDSFRLHREIYRIPQDAFGKRLDQLTSLLDVRHLLSQPVRELSLGERMRMELIAALLHDPDVLLLDEPTIGLDVVSQRRVQEFLKAWQQERKVTVLLTSHYMKDVEALCQRAIIINQGEIRHDGPISEIQGQFSRFKRIQLRLTDSKTAEDWSGYGRVLEHAPGRVTLEVARSDVPAVLGKVLAEHTMEDVSVQERPLEEVIAEFFAASSASSTTADPRRTS